MAERIFLDACVLYPRAVRALLLGAAEAGLVTPFWSGRVLREWRIAAARAGAAEEQAAAEAAHAMAVRFPAAEVEPAEMPDLTPLPDPADAHVLAGAVAAGASQIVTFNLRDFPARRLAGFGIAPRHPDGLLWELLGRAPERMRPLVDAVAGAAGEPREGRRLLRRAGLPRLGKAWALG